MVLCATVIRLGEADGKFCLFPEGRREVRDQRSIAKGSMILRAGVIRSKAQDAWMKPARSNAQVGTVGTAF